MIPRPYWYERVPHWIPTYLINTTTIHRIYPNSGDAAQAPPDVRRILRIRGWLEAYHVLGQRPQPFSTGIPKLPQRGSISS